MLPAILTASILFRRFSSVLSFLFLLVLLVPAYFSQDLLMEWGALGVGGTTAILGCVYFFSLPRCREVKNDPSQKLDKVLNFNENERIRLAYIALCFAFCLLGPILFLSSSLHARERVLLVFLWFCFAFVLSKGVFWALALNPELERYQMRKEMQRLSARRGFAHFLSGLYLVLGVIVLVAIVLRFL
jgi:uncharacterized membrane protein YjfL (UPF0719 family)